MPSARIGRWWKGRRQKAPQANPIFARGELQRLAIDMLREAGKQLAIRDMALGAFRTKGVRFPDRRTMKATRVRLREVFAKLQAPGRGADGRDREGDAAGADIKRGTGA